MIVLVGFMGAGKSTVGRLLARELGIPFVDSDALIAVRTGTSVQDIFRTHGEPGFRQIERDVVGEILAGPEAVVSLGGGALTDPTTCTALGWATVIHLDVSFAEAMRRARADDVVRPLLASGDPKALMAERETLYRRVATHTIHTDGRSPAQVVAEVLASVGDGSEGRRSAGPTHGVEQVVVPLGDRAYGVFVGEGIAGRTATLVPVDEDRERVVIVTHPSLSPVAGAVAQGFEAGGVTASVLEVPEGESSKSLDATGTVYGRLADLGVHRHDLIVGVGGGVVTDLTGFVAGTYLRGVAVVHVPTTLLGQVDAAIGGKAGVNLAQGKNLVGVFHQPAGVVCDVQLLDGLPDEELRAGLGEVVKYGFIADPSLLTTVENEVDAIMARDHGVLIDVVARCAAVKAAVVAADERDSGRRMQLNYGHTFAHAIERTSGYGAIRHGEAVGLGMLAAALLAHEVGLIDVELVERHRSVLKRAGLPVTATLDVGQLEDAWAHDKKYRRGVRFVLLEGLARPKVDVEVPADAIKRAIARLAP